MIGTYESRTSWSRARGRSLNGWFLAFLAGASLAVMVPAGVRSRRSSPYSAAQTFKKRMALMAPRGRGGRWVVVPELHVVDRSRPATRPLTRRRMRVGVLLGIGVVATAVWAVTTGGAALPVHVAVDAVCAIYVALVYRADRRSRERRRKVHHMPRPYGEPPALNVAEVGGRR
ncbi:MAG TPA: hypothetical protein VFK89_03845 [Actinomycetota bacterium]|nr:hypothetical protein [Actinomycetota bacterium]